MCELLFLIMEAVPGTSHGGLLDETDTVERSIDVSNVGEEYAESEGSNDDIHHSDLDEALEDAEDDPDDIVESDLKEDLEYSPQWQPTTAGMREIIFTRENVFKVPFPGENRPFDWFALLVDDVLLENIVQCTNAYAWEVYGKPSLIPKSRINKWKDLTVPELKTFIGLLIHMGTVRINRFNDYWNTSRYFDFKFVREQMSRDRFLVILRCLHFRKNDVENCQRDRLHNVRLLIDEFNTKMDNVYYPGKKLPLDEGTILWRGRLLFRQYIKGKRHK